jgi:hypothetical protein
MSSTSARRRRQQAWRGPYGVPVLPAGTGPWFFRWHPYRAEAVFLLALSLGLLLALVSLRPWSAHPFAMAILGLFWAVESYVAVTTVVYWESVQVVDDEVHLSMGWSVRKTIREPLSAYRKVNLIVDRNGSWRSDPDQFDHVVVLEHADPSRSIELLRTASQREAASYFDEISPLLSYRLASNG